MFFIRIITKIVTVVTIAIINRRTSNTPRMTNRASDFLPLVEFNSVGLKIFKTSKSVAGIATGRELGVTGRDDEAVGGGSVVRNNEDDDAQDEGIVEIGCCVLWHVEVAILKKVHC